MPGGAPLAANACLPGARRRAHARCVSSEPARQPGRLRGRPGGPCAAEPSGSRTAPRPDQRSCCGPLPVQAALGPLHEHAERGRGLLPLALSAVEAALRRVPDAADDSEANAARVAARQARPGRGFMSASSAGCTGSHAAASLAKQVMRARGRQARPCHPQRCRRRAQAVGHGVELLTSGGPGCPGPPAARALLATLAKLLAMAHAPGSAMRDGLWVRRPVPAPSQRPWRRMSCVHVGLLGVRAPARP